MLIGVIDVVKHPQGIVVSGATIPALIRLDTIHDCLVVGGHSLYFGSSFGFVSVASIKDRKLPAPLGYLHSKDVSEMVKGGA